MLITQALDLAQHTASAYHQAPDHIRRMLNQLFFDHVYLVPDQDTDQLTTTATCLPPFDSILRWRATADVEWSEWFFSDSGDMVFWWRDRMGLCRE